MSRVFVLFCFALSFINTYRHSSPYIFSFHLFIYIFFSESSNSLSFEVVYFYFIFLFRLIHIFTIVNVFLTKTEKREEAGKKEMRYEELIMHIA